MIRRYAIAGIAAVAVVVLFFLFVLSPKLGDITEVQEQVEQVEDEQQSLRIRLRQLQQAQTNEPQTRARLATFERLLPSTPDLPVLIRQLQSTATVSGIDLASIAPSPPTTLAGATGIQVVAVNIQVRGGFFRLQTFLARLEDLQRAVEVTSLAISPGTDAATGLATLSSTITLRMYVVEPNARLAGAAPAPAPTPASTP